MNQEFSRHPEFKREKCDYTIKSRLVFNKLLRFSDSSSPNPIKSAKRYYLQDMVKNNFLTKGK